MIKKFEEFIKLYESRTLRTKNWRKEILMFLSERAYISERNRKHSKFESDKINLYCFIDLSGSVELDIVYTFLNEVIGCCIESEYSTIFVYGFGEHLTDPYKLNIDSLSLNDIDNVVLNQIWDFLSSQKIGYTTENFINIAEEMHKIKMDDRNAAFMIFGDGHWEDSKKFKKVVNGENICVLAYYNNDDDSHFDKCIAALTDAGEIKNVITTHVKELL
jgi:hypothetical protein